MWKKICERKQADLNAVTEYGGTLNPNQPKIWHSDRKLSSNFLETILTSNPIEAPSPPTVFE